MASRHRYAARPRDETPSEYSDDYYSSGYTSEGSYAEDYPEAEPNNRRLRQAISYLEEEGRDDSDDLYKERLNQIDSEIIAKFVDEEYAFDEGLYARLEELMEEQFNAIEEAEEVAREEEEYERELEEIEEARPSHALHRDLEASDNLPLSGSSRPRISKGKGKEKIVPSPPTSTSASAGKGKGKAAAQPPRRRSNRGFLTAYGYDTLDLQTPPSLPSPVAPRVQTGAASPSTKPKVIREIPWRYGGPHNEPEFYHADAPDSLPFGETLAFQEYESLQIEYDLAQGPLRKGPVETNVEFSLVDERMGPKGTPYDSGSRFKLIDDQKESAVGAARTYLGLDEGGEEEGEGLDALKQAVAEFNTADEASQIEKDYAPRVFLELVQLPRVNAPRRKFARKTKEATAPATASPSASQTATRVGTKSATQAARTATSQPAAVAGTKRTSDAPSATASAMRPASAESRPAKRVAFDTERRTGTMTPEARAAVRGMTKTSTGTGTGTRTATKTATRTATRGSTRSGVSFKG